MADDKQRILHLGPQWRRAAASVAQKLIACPTCSAARESPCAKTMLAPGRKVCQTRITLAADLLIERRGRQTAPALDMPALDDVLVGHVVDEWRKGLRAVPSPGAEIAVMSAYKALATAGIVRVIAEDVTTGERVVLWGKASGANQ